MNHKVITLYIQNSGIKYGGAYRRYIELIEGMLARGWEVHHVSPKGFSNIVHKNFKHHGVLRIPCRPAYLPFTIQAIPRTINIARKHHVNLLVAFTLFDAFIGIATRLFRPSMKVIMCDRGSSIEGIKTSFEPHRRVRYFISPVIFILKAFERLVYRQSNLVIFNSNFRRTQITEVVNLKLEETKLIYNNINPSWVLKCINEVKKSSPKVRDRWPERKLLLYVGNLHLYGRDILTLLKAFKIVKNKIPKATLILVGDGPDKKGILNHAHSLNLYNDVILEGWIDNPLSYMLASDIIIVPALHEGFSNTILEAMYLNAIVLGSKVGGIPEALKYEQLLFPAKDEITLANKIIYLLTDKEKREEALKLVRERRTEFIFDWTGEMIDAVQGTL